MQNFKHASDNIKLLLSFKNWSQETLAKKSGISIATLKRKLRNNNGWTLLEATAIAHALGVSVEELFFTQLVPSGIKA